MASGRIKGITVEIGGDTTRLIEALKDVDSQIRRTQYSLTDVNKLLKLDPSNTELLKQKQRLLGDQIEKTKERLKTLKEASENVTPDDIGQDKYDDLQREIVETEEKLKSLQTEAAKSASVLGSQMQAAGEQIKAVGDNMMSIGKDVSMKVTLPLVAVGTAGARSFAEVDKVMQLTNETMGNTEEQAQALSQAMKDAAANSTFGMQDAAQAALNFARAGLNAEQAAAALAPAMNLAAGEGGNLDTVSAGLVATINGFHGSFDDAADYADVFAAACNNSALDVDSLSSAMSVAAPIFSSAGYSVRDAALFMGVMANAGIDAGSAANSLKTGLARLVSPAKEGAEMMEELGISVTNADGSMKDSVQIQAELHDAFADLSESEQIAAASAIFGKSQMSSWLALIGTAPEDVGELEGALSDCSGTTREMADAMMSGFGGSLEKLKSSVDVLSTSLGEALAPTIQRVSDKIQELVDKFNALSPQQQQAIVNIGIAVAAIGPLIMAVGAVAKVIGIVVGGIGAAVTAVGAFTGALAAGEGAAAGIGAAIAALGGPVTVITAAIIGIIAVGALLVANWDLIKEKCGELGQWICEKWDGLYKDTKETFDNIKKGLGEIWDAISTETTQKAAEIKDGITQKWGELKASGQEKWEQIKQTISEKMAGAKTTASEKAESIKNDLQSRFGEASSTTQSKFGEIKAGISEKMSGARQTVADKVNEIKGFFNGISPNTVTSKFGEIKAGISGKMNEAKQAVSEAIERIKSKFNFSWSLPKLKLPHISVSGSFSLMPPKAPSFSVNWYAKAMQNGMVLTNPTIFGMANGKLLGGGEAGPEAVVGVGSLREMIREAVAASGMNANDMYAAVKAGMQSADVTLVIGERSADRFMRDSGVRFT